MVWHGGSSAGSYLTDPTSPIPSHCASFVATSTVRVNTEQYKCMQMTSVTFFSLTLTVRSINSTGQWLVLWTLIAPPPDAYFTSRAILPLFPLLANLPCRLSPRLRCSSRAYEIWPINIGHKKVDSHLKHEILCSTTEKTRLTHSCSMIPAKINNAMHQT